MHIIFYFAFGFLPCFKYLNYIIFHSEVPMFFTKSAVTSQIFNLECYTLDHHCIAYFIAFWQILENPKQLKDPRRELGIFPVFHI